MTTDPRLRMTETALEEHVRAICTQVGVVRVHQLYSRGTHAGWVDDVLIGPGGVLFRELKTETGRVSAAQQEMHVLLAGAGMDVAVWRPRDLVSGRVAREVTAISRLGARTRPATVNGDARG